MVGCQNTQYFVARHYSLCPISDDVIITKKQADTIIGVYLFHKSLWQPDAKNMVVEF